MRSANSPPGCGNDTVATAISRSLFNVLLDTPGIDVLEVQCARDQRRLCCIGNDDKPFVDQSN